MATVLEHLPGGHLTYLKDGWVVGDMQREDSTEIVAYHLFRHATQTLHSCSKNVTPNANPRGGYIIKIIPVEDALVVLCESAEIYCLSRHILLAFHLDATRTKFVEIDLSTHVMWASQSQRTSLCEAVNDGGRLYVRLDDCHSVGGGWIMVRREYSWWMIHVEHGIVVSLISSILDGYPPPDKPHMVCCGMRYMPVCLIQSGVHLQYLTNMSKASLVVAKHKHQWSTICLLPHHIVTAPRGGVDRVYVITYSEEERFSSTVHVFCSAYGKHPRMHIIHAISPNLNVFWAQTERGSLLMASSPAKSECVLNAICDDAGEKVQSSRNWPVADLSNMIDRSTNVVAVCPDSSLLLSRYVEIECRIDIAILSADLSVVHKLYAIQLGLVSVDVSEIDRFCMQMNAVSDAGTVTYVPPHPPSCIDVLENSALVRIPRPLIELIIRYASA